MRSNRPKSKEFDEMAQRFAAGALVNIQKEFERRHLLPLNKEAHAVILAVMQNVARQSQSAIATLALTGTDVTLAVLPPPPNPAQPPTPL